LPIQLVLPELEAAALRFVVFAFCAIGIVAALFIVLVIFEEYPFVFCCCQNATVNMRTRSAFLLVPVLFVDTEQMEQESDNNTKICVRSYYFHHFFSFPFLSRFLSVTLSLCNSL
jgi:hypothetical protein